LAAFDLGYQPRHYRLWQRVLCQTLDTKLTGGAMSAALDRVERCLFELADETHPNVDARLPARLSRARLDAESLMDDARATRRDWFQQHRERDTEQPSLAVPSREPWQDLCWLTDCAVHENTQMKAWVALGAALGNYTLQLDQWNGQGDPPSLRGVVEAVQMLPDHSDGLPAMLILLRQSSPEQCAAESAAAALRYVTDKTDLRMVLLRGSLRLQQWIEGYLTGQTRQPSQESSGLAEADDADLSSQAYLDLRVDPEARTIARTGRSRQVTLLNSERHWDLFWALYERGDSWYPKDALVHRVWQGDFRSPATIDSTICRLRKKLCKHLKVTIECHRLAGCRLVVAAS
jgi:DNA-binding response OmpR family regulator